MKWIVVEAPPLAEAWLVRTNKDWRCPEIKIPCQGDCSLKNHVIDVPPFNPACRLWFGASSATEDIVAPRFRPGTVEATPLRLMSRRVRNCYNHSWRIERGNKMKKGRKTYSRFVDVELQRHGQLILHSCFLCFRFVHGVVKSHITSKIFFEYYPYSIVDGSG